MSDYLPPEILTNIISRLPAKSLIKLRCVSKSWDNLIKSSDFIATHLTQSIISCKTNRRFLIRHCTENPKKENYTLHCNDEPFSSYQELHHSFESENPFFRVVGSCNGIVCLVDDFEILTCTFILWNPLIRKAVVLPEPGVTYESHSGCNSVVGFGFDSVNNDYKVVRLVCTHGNQKAELSIQPEIEVYSLKTGTWRSVSGPGVLRHYKILSMQAMVNEEPHWLAFRKWKDGTFNNFVLSFGMREEVFRKMVLPDCLVGVFPLYLAILVVRESVTISHYDVGNKSFDIWVRIDYDVKGSWIKQFSIEIPGRVLGSWKNGHILVQNTNGEMLSYNPEGQRYERVGICDSLGFPIPSVRSYVESLVLLDIHNAVNPNGRPGNNGERRYFVQPRGHVGVHN